MREHLPNTVQAVIALLSVFVIAQVIERRNRERREAAGLAPHLPQPATGFWAAHLDAETIRRDLAVLAGDPGSAERMFRTAAGVRRMFQQSIGDIAAVALTVPDLSADVDHVGRLADDLVELQEAWRTAVRERTPESLALAQGVLPDTVAALDSTLIGMQPRAKLPAGLPPTP